MILPLWLYHDMPQRPVQLLGPLHEILQDNNSGGFCFFRILGS